MPLLLNLIKPPNMKEQTQQPTIAEMSEELAEEMYPLILGYYDTESYIDGFIAGRKSFGDKKYHLSEEELANILVLGSHYDFSLEQILKYINPPIYPTKITVDFDGEKYYWETLKAEYE